MAITELSEIFKALSEITRLKILKLLEHGELCVCDINAALDMVQPKVSFHLKVLKSVGLIKDTKVGRWIHYSLNESDIFVRFLLMSALERIDNADIEQYKQRLDAFMKVKGRRYKKRLTGCKCNNEQQPAPL